MFFFKFHIDREIITTNGNRYDVNLVERTRTPVYWTDEPNEIRRSKWFYLPEQDSRFVPFDEQMNEILEVKKKRFLLLFSMNRIFIFIESL